VFRHLRALSLRSSGRRTGVTRDDTHRAFYDDAFADLVFAHSIIPTLIEGWCSTCWRSSSMSGLPSSLIRAGVLHHLHRAADQLAPGSRMNNFDVGNGAGLIWMGKAVGVSTCEGSRARRYDEPGCFRAAAIITSLLNTQPAADRCWPGGDALALRRGVVDGRMTLGDGDGQPS
jgi:hypothetical protein